MSVDDADLRRAVEAAEHEMPYGTPLALIAFVKASDDGGVSQMLMLGNRPAETLKAAIRDGTLNWGN